MPVTILTGDALKNLKGLKDDTFDCVVTSPPYWGLRNYDVDGQLGMEPTLYEHIIAMVAVFEEVKRVLKPSGTCFINYGDCYASTPNGRKAKDIVNDDRTFRDKPFSTVGPVSPDVRKKIRTNAKEKTGCRTATGEVIMQAQRSPQVRFVRARTIPGRYGQGEP